MRSSFGGWDERKVYGGRACPWTCEYWAETGEPQHETYTGTSGCIWGWARCRGASYMTPILRNVVWGDIVRVFYVISIIVCVGLRSWCRPRRAIEHGHFWVGLPRAYMHLNCACLRSSHTGIPVSVHLPLFSTGSKQRWTLVSRNRHGVEYIYKKKLLRNRTVISSRQESYIQ